MPSLHTQTGGDWFGGRIFDVRLRIQDVGLSTLDKGLS